MSTIEPVVAFQGPPGDVLCNYDRNIPGSQQPQSIPQVLRDAMTVREIVFVHEKKNVLLPHHIDPDDARACHWVLYVPSSDPSPSGEPQLRPVGTIRLVPYPHGPHPEPGASYDAPGEDDPVEASETFFRQPPPEYHVHRATSLHDGKEPYLKLGRLCVIDEFRGKKFANVLIQAALKWASENPYFGKEGMPEWRGLVFAHAQETAIKTWERNGFVIDEEVGVATVIRIKHYGLFHRVNIKIW